jgi:ribonuclease D
LTAHDLYAIVRNRTEDKKKGYIVTKLPVMMLEGDLDAEWLHAAKASRCVGVDIETSGLDKYTNKIATVQIYVPNKGTIMVRNFTSIWNIQDLLEDGSTTKIFHHAPFDLGFLMHHYPMLPKNIADTKVAAKILDPRKRLFIHPQTNKGSHSLQTLVWHYFEDMLDKSLAVSNWFDPNLSPAQVEYAAKDVIYLPRLLRRLEQELSKMGDLMLARAAYKHIPTKVALELKNIDSVYEY